MEVIVDDRKDCCAERFRDVELRVGDYADIADVDKNVLCDTQSYANDGVTQYT